MCLFLEYHVVPFICMYLCRVLWASAAQLMSRNGVNLVNLLYLPIYYNLPTLARGK